MKKSWIGFRRCYFSMRQLGICPPQLLASLPTATVSLPRGTKSVFLFSSQWYLLFYLLSFSVCPQLAVEIQTPSSNSWGYPDNSLLMWAGSWGAVGWVLGCCGLAKSCSKHLAWGGHHHKPELIAVCTSQRQSPVIKQGGIRSWHYCIQPGTDEDTKLGAEWERGSGKLRWEESQCN